MKINDRGTSEMPAKQKLSKNLFKIWTNQGNKEKNTEHETSVASENYNMLLSRVKLK